MNSGIQVLFQFGRSARSTLPQCHRSRGPNARASIKDSDSFSDTDKFSSCQSQRLVDPPLLGPIGKMVRPLWKLHSSRLLIRSDIPIWNYSDLVWHLSPDGRFRLTGSNPLAASANTEGNGKESTQGDEGGSHRYQSLYA